MGPETCGRYYRPVQCSSLALIDGPDGFVALIPDSAMRKRVEMFLICPETTYSGRKVNARNLSTEDLRRPMVRQTIQGVLTCVEKLRNEQPDIARRLHL
jgi:hypothetical protein